MNEIKLITKDTIHAEADERIRKGHVANADEMIHIVTPAFGFGNTVDDNLRAIANSRPVGHSEKLRVSADSIMKYGSAWDIPRACKTLGGKMMSVRDMINAGVFTRPQGSSNTLPEDWSSLWDAMRIDISIRKSAMDTVRQNFYNIVNMPNSDKVIKVDEFFPYSTVFEENNGEGQAVTQGETRFGQSESVEHKIYAASWTWTLLNDLFNKSMDPGKLSDSVLLGYNAKRDDLSMSPILDFSYSGAQQTAAATLSGANRQELLYLTLEDAIDDLGDRDDPILDRPVDPMGSVILAHSYDARHIARVGMGLPSTNERSYPGISEIASVVAYDTEVIRGRKKDVTYTGVTKGKAYLIKKNRYMNVGIKRPLTLETDMTPDVSTLAREKRAWYFVEGQQTTGIQYFVQEITLPTW